MNILTFWALAEQSVCKLIEYEDGPEAGGNS